MDEIKIKVMILEGIIYDIIGIPENTIIEIHDYDKESYEEEDLTTDKNGEKVHINTWRHNNV